MRNWHVINHAKRRRLFVLREMNYWLMYNGATGVAEATYFDQSKQLMIGKTKITCSDPIDAINKYIEYRDGCGTMAV